jgi:hypothetical protein
MFCFVCVAAFIQCDLLDEVYLYLNECSIRYCFAHAHHPLSRALDELFADWVGEQASYFRLQSERSALAAEAQKQQAREAEARRHFDLEQEMDEFLPLHVAAHQRARTGATTTSSRDGSRVSDGFGADVYTDAALSSSDSATGSTTSTTCTATATPSNGLHMSIQNNGTNSTNSTNGNNGTIALGPPPVQNAWLSRNSHVRSAGPLGQHK